MGDDPIVLATHTFSEADHKAFAELSGDHNPIHVDALFARRTQAGRRVVHGVHQLMWALDASLAADPGPGSISRIQAKFARLVGVGETAKLSVAPRGPNARTLYVKVGDAVTCLAVVTFGAAKEARASRPSEQDPVDAALPIERTFEEASEVLGWLSVVASEDAAKAFPVLAQVMGPVRAAALLQLTRWVGMVNPGLHSIFTAVDVSCVEEESNVLCFNVSTAVERFRHLKQSVEGGGLSGSVDSLVRIPPVRQASMAEVGEQVLAGEFDRMKALVIGASRGLGEITAKVISAGGGTVIGTYAVGEKDAASVAAEIRAAGGSCEILPYLVGDSATTILPRGVNAVFYFATPPVQPGSAPEFDQELFHSYIQTYAAGFARVCARVIANTDREVWAFYPSTVYVEDRPEGLAEYAMAKAAGEILCAELPRKLPRLHTFFRRIPRVLTDLSASAFDHDSGDPLPVAIDFVREMASLMGLAASGQEPLEE